MTSQDKTPTLGQSTGGNKGQGGGFNKKPAAVLMNVNAADVQQMQRGYEMRIARQRDAINRLQMLLSDTQEKFSEWMRDEAGRAAHIDESDQAPVLAVAGGGVIDDAELDELLHMIPEGWDMYNEDDTARTIIAGYIKHLKEDADAQRAKQEYLVKEYKKPLEELTALMGNRIKPYLIQGHSVSACIAAYVTQVEQERDETTRNLAQAIADARNNAKQANQALQVVDADDTPPWEKQGPQAFVQPATVGAAGVWSNEPPPEISETLTDWAGAAQLPPGEERPGRAF